MKMIDHSTRSLVEKILLELSLTRFGQINPAPLTWQQKRLIHSQPCNPPAQWVAEGIKAFIGDWFHNRLTAPLLVIVGGSLTAKSDILKKVASFARGASFMTFERGNWQEPPDHCQWAWNDLAVQGERLDSDWYADLLAPSLAVIHGVAANVETPLNVKNLLNPILNGRATKFTVVTTDVPPSTWEDDFDEIVAERLQTKSRIVDLSIVQKLSPAILEVQKN